LMKSRCRRTCHGKKPSLQMQPLSSHSRCIEPRQWRRPSKLLWKGNGERDTFGSQTDFSTIWNDGSRHPIEIFAGLCGC
jgi:hypothetical protein